MKITLFTSVSLSVDNKVDEQSPSCITYHSNSTLATTCVCLLILLFIQHFSGINNWGFLIWVVFANTLILT